MIQRYGGVVWNISTCMPFKLLRYELRLYLLLPKLFLIYFSVASIRSRSHCTLIRSIYHRLKPVTVANRSRHKKQLMCSSDEANLLSSKKSRPLEIGYSVFQTFLFIYFYAKVVHYDCLFTSDVSESCCSVAKKFFDSLSDRKP